MTRRSIRSLTIALAVPLGSIAAWWFGSAGSTSVFFPPLRAILSAFRATWLFSHVASDMLPSLWRLTAGYAIGATVGIGVGALLGRQPTLHRAFQPAIEFARATPGIGLIPVSITLLGIGDTQKIALIAFVCVFPVLLNTIDGVRSVEAGLEDVARVFGLTRRQRIVGIQIRSAMPQIFVGLRIAIALAFITMIVSEMVGATSGIGYVTLTAQNTFQIPVMWAGMILLAIMGAVLNVGFVLIERRVLRWHFR